MCDKRCPSGWEEVRKSCGSRGPLALVQVLSKPITLSKCAVFTANLPSSCDIVSCVDNYKLVLSGVKKSRFILGPPTVLPAVIL